MRALVEALHRVDAYPHPVGRVEHIETHISHVLLAGEFAYKLKKPLNLGFLDFSTLARRKHCCEEEIRLNARLAPGIYLGVVAITGTPEAPRIGGRGEVIEYAVKMRRFDQDCLLTRRPVTPELADRIAERVAAFHGSVPAAPVDSVFGEPDGRAAADGGEFLADPRSPARSGCAGSDRSARKLDPPPALRAATPDHGS